MKQMTAKEAGFKEELSRHTGSKNRTMKGNQKRGIDGRLPAALILINHMHFYPNTFIL
jgi:hypothetical protein